MVADDAYKLNCQSQQCNLYYLISLRGEIGRRNGLKIHR
jgi:hypothetical protein